MSAIGFLFFVFLFFFFSSSCGTGVVFVEGRPNIIVMQPDDLSFMDGWNPPPNNPNPDDRDLVDPFPHNDGNGMRHIDSLRSNGLQMTQAYAASPMCGTSRFSTITGKWPSRAISVREECAGFDEPSWVVIPTTKLEGADCASNNMAVAFRDAGYETAMFGKWHLTSVDEDDYTYAGATDTVKGCGFDTVKALYVENFRFFDGSHAHNMEWMTYEAIGFINSTTAADQNFFMYFNPTVPHPGNDVEEAIVDYDCTDVADPNYQWTSDPWIKGMSEDAGCRAYRDTIVDRAETFDDLGKIWLDDAVGALLHALRDTGVLDNTVFLFQEDHGTDAKSTLYEGGVRIPQFIHYPDGISPGTTFDGLVSTVDVAATMMDFAGITPPYPMDGKSWKDSVGSPSEEDYWKNERCLFFEMQYDRAVRCGCYKYLHIYAEYGFTYRRGGQLGYSNDIGGILFNLCDNSGNYVTNAQSNREENTVTNGFVQPDLAEALDCHLEATDADANPDFTVCGSIPPTKPPTGVPTHQPTALPTRIPTPSPTKRPKSAKKVTKSQKRSKKRSKKNSDNGRRKVRVLRALPVRSEEGETAVH